MIKINYKVLLLVAIIFAQAIQYKSTAQSSSEPSKKTSKLNEKYRKIVLQLADDRYDNLDYGEAIPLYEQVLAYLDNKMATVRLADCYRLTNKYKNAEKWYAKVVLFKDIDPINHLYYGQSLRNNNKLDEAKKHFLTFSELKPDNPRGKLYASSCDKVMEWSKNSPTSEVFNVKKINTPVADFCPVYYNNGLVFTSERGQDLINEEFYGWTGRPYLSLFYTEVKFRNDSTLWGETELFSTSIESECHDGPVCFNAGENIVYFTRVRNIIIRKKSDFINRPKLYSAEVKGGRWKETGGNKWRKIKSFEYNSNQYSVMHPSLSRNGKYLFFASDMPGGYGGGDIYVCKDKGNKWGKPVNLGPAINTTGNEMFPSIRDDGTLFFSSDGHEGYGGQDIFSATKAGDTGDKWGNVTNLKAPINSVSDDFGIIYLQGNDKGFFSSNREGGLGDDDIYRFTLLELSQPEVSYIIEGTIISLTDKGNEELLSDVTVKLMNEKYEVIDESYTFKEGKFKFSRVKPGTNYSVFLQKKDYLTIIKNIGKSLSSNDLKGDNTVMIKAKVVMDKIVIGKEIVLKNIYYDYEKADINETAAKELDNLLQIMENNPDIKIELSSNTDVRGDAGFNMDLSQKRAESAATYITSKGIAPYRITAKGYGETKPKVPNAASEEEHQQNRRTSFTILEKE